MAMSKREPDVRFRAWVVLMLVVGVPAYCQACGVPVFRYALERWSPDTYQAIVFHEGSLTPSDQERVDRLKALEVMGYGRPPLVVRTRDVGQEIDEATKPVWEACKEGTLPLLVLLPPEWQESTRVLWSGSLSDESIELLVQSPVRRELVDRLTDGQTAVWLFLPSGDPDKDDQVTALLREKLPEVQASLKLPHELDPDDTTYDMPMQSDVDLRIEFSLLTLDLNDPQESVLAGLLRGSMSEGLDAYLPGLIPVFGRGRALAFLPDDVIGPEAIEEICSFVTGPCSCQIKQQNPGVDLFIPVDWDGLITGLMGPEEIPALLVVPAASESQEAVGPNRQTLGQTVEPGSRADSLKWNLVGIGVAGLLLVAIGTGVLLRKSSR